MARMYDLRRLRQAVSITEVLTHYQLDINLRERRGELVGPCPLPGHGGDRSNRSALRVNPARGVWNCFTHCGGGDVVEMVAVMHGGDYAAAARALAQIELGRCPTTFPRERAPTATAPSRFVPYTKALRRGPGGSPMRWRPNQ